MMFTAVSVPRYLALPTLVQTVVTSGSVTPLYGFWLASSHFILTPNYCDIDCYSHVF
jgi:hypothetical protein